VYDNGKGMTKELKYVVLELATGGEMFDLI